jgi:Tol biopolymer transport system component
MLRLALWGAAWVAASCSAGESEWWETPVPEPQLFAPGVISSGDRDYDIAFTPDGREAYFTRRGRRGSPRIFVSTHSEQGWSDPVPAAFGSGGEEAPFITPDGLTMVFSSRRQAPGQPDPGDDIWIVRREGPTWSEPQPVRGPVNQPAVRIGRYTLGTELGPSLLPDGSLLYWTRTDPEWGGDLYVARPDGSGGFAEPMPLRVNSYGDESNPVSAPGGRYIVFQAYRDAQGLGEQDLYAIERTEYGWSDPVLLPAPINSAHSDGWPSFSPDGRRFFFASDRGDRPGYYDIYWVDVAALGLVGLESTWQAGGY